MQNLTLIVNLSKALGKEKGTSVLTKEGKEICKKYEDMMAEINTAVDNAFAKYFLNK